MKMEQFEFKNRVYEVESLEPAVCYAAVASGDLTQEEAERVYFQVCQALGYDLTPWSSRAQQIQTLKDSLTASDYIALKAFEGHDVSEYGDWKTDRQNIRNEINRLENLTDEAWNEENKAKWEE